MARITGTGCMLTCIMGTFMAVVSPLRQRSAELLSWELPENGPMLQRDLEHIT
mgnify:FL=1